MPPLATTYVVSVLVQDVNEPPALTSGQVLRVDENSAPGTPVGSVNASDPDAGDALVFSIMSGNTGNTFAIDPQSGSITVASTTNLNYEVRSSAAVQAEGAALHRGAREQVNPTFSLAVKVMDRDGEAATGIVRVLIGDVNEPPLWRTEQIGQPERLRSVPAGSLANTPVGAPLLATDPEGDAVSYYFVVGNGTGAVAVPFTVITESGQVTVTGPSALPPLGVNEQGFVGNEWEHPIRACDARGLCSSDSTLHVTLIANTVRPIPRLEHSCSASKLNKLVRRTCPE